MQRRWAVWGFVILIASVSLFAAAFGGIFYALKTSDAYRLGVARLGQSREADDLLGLPIATGFPLGSIRTSGQSGEAVLDFSATGRKATGRVTVRAVKTNGEWALTGMTLRVDKSGDVIDLLRDDHAFLDPPDSITMRRAA